MKVEPAFTKTRHNVNPLRSEASTLLSLHTKHTDMAAENKEKLKALQLTLDVDKTYGKGTVMKLGDEAVEKVDAISSIPLPRHRSRRGRIPPRTGRGDLRSGELGQTTLATHAIAEAQKAGGIYAFIDAEHAFDKYYAEKLGGHPPPQPDNGEQALEIADNLIRSGAIDLIVILPWPP